MNVLYSYEQLERHNLKMLHFFKSCRVLYSNACYEKYTYVKILGFKNSKDFAYWDKFTYHGDDYFTSKNSYIISSVSLGGLRPVWENYPDDVIRVISAVTLRLKMYDTKTFE